MSSLLASYDKLTEQINQGIFTSENLLLRSGQIFTSGFNSQALGGSPNSIYIGITTGNLLTVIGERETQSTSPEFSILSYEESVYTGGTDLPILSNNRALQGTPEASIVISPTISDNGNQIGARKVRGVAGQGNKDSSSMSFSSPLFVLKPNTKYLIRFQNDDNSSAELDFSVRFAELS